MSQITIARLSTANPRATWASSRACTVASGWPRVTRSLGLAVMTKPAVGSISSVDPRRQFIEKNARFADNLDI